MGGPGPSGGMCCDVGPHHFGADNPAARVDREEQMINAIGAMHATLRSKKRPVEPRSEPKGGARDTRADEHAGDRREPARKGRSA